MIKIWSCIELTLNNNEKIEKNIGTLVQCDKVMSVLPRIFVGFKNIFYNLIKNNEKYNMYDTEIYNSNATIVKRLTDLLKL